MSDVERYLEHARACDELARRSSDPFHRDQFRHIASEWRELADRVDRSERGERRSFSDQANPSKK